MSTTSILKKVSISALILACAGIIRGILGLLSQVFIAYRFGTSSSVDSFLIALTVPRFFGDFLVGGTLFFAFIPVFIDWKTKKGEAAAWHLAINFFLIIGVAMGAVTLIYAVFAPAVMRLLAPGFSGETLALTIKIARVLSPAILIFCLAIMLRSLLYAYKEFLVPSISGLMYPLTVIIFVYLLTGRFGIYSLVLGAILGASIQAFFQLVKVYRLNRCSRFKLDIMSPDLKRIMTLTWPLAWTMLLYQVNHIVIRIFASSLEKGSIAALNYSYQLINVPIAILAVSIGTALFPNISEKLSEKDITRSRKMTSAAFRMCLFLLVPLSAGLCLLSKPIIRIIFERGSFNAASTALTSGCLLFYSLGLFAMGLNVIAARIFYSLKDTMTPLKVGIVGVAINIICAYFLKDIMGAEGLALAFSIYIVVSSVILWVLLDKNNQMVRLSQVIFPVLRILAMSAITTVLVYTVFLCTNFIIAVIAGISGYALLSYIFKMEEFFRIKEMLASVFLGRQAS
ncbi:murein biosynthesis integral membrane protein MurJ [Candidatus Omnitrophota bacterium]